MRNLIFNSFITLSIGYLLITKGNKSRFPQAWHVQSRLTLCDPLAPLSNGLSRQEYVSEWPFPPPGDLPDPGIKPKTPALQADFLPLSHLGSPPAWQMSL